MNTTRTFFPNNQNKGNKLIIFIGAVISILSLLALIYLKPNLKNNKLEKIAIIENFNKNVRLKSSGSSSFFNISKNETLQNSDEIFTGENSSATVRFIKSNTQLKIPSSSLVKIEEGENGDVIEVKDGLVDIILEKGQEITLKENGELHNISSQEEKSTIKASISSGQIKIISNTKSVTIKDKSGERELVKNEEAVIITPKIDLQKIEKTPPVDFEILKPLNNEKITTQTDINVLLNKNLNFIIEIKSLEDQKLIARKSFSKNSLIFKNTLNPGKYELKVKTLEISKTITFEVPLNIKITGHTPQNNEIISSNPNENISLIWDEAKVKKYKIIIQINNENEKILYSNIPRIEIPPIKNGQITWTVIGELEDGSTTIENKSIQNSIKITDEIIINSKTKNKFSISEKEFPISWKAKYSKNFKITIFEKTINEEGEKYTELFNSNLKENINETKIFLKKIGNFKIVISSLDYPETKNGEFPYSTKGPILDWLIDFPSELKSIEDELDYELSYKENISLKETSKLYIKHTNTNNQNSKVEPLEFENKKVSKIKIKLKGHGRYCFIAHLNKPIDLYTDTESKCLNFIQLPPFDSIPKPKNEILKFNKNEQETFFTFILPKVDRAIKYQVEVFKDINAKNLVFKSTSENEEIKWNTKRSGIYFYRYKVYDNKNRASSYSEVSKIIFPISPLSDWKEEGAK